MPALLCVPILVTDVPAALKDAQSARDLGADLVEFRIDHLFHGGDDAAEIESVVDLIGRSPLPCIATCRPIGPEGGYYDGPDDARIALFERLGTAFGEGEQSPRYIDVELSTWQRSANIQQKIRLAIDHPEQIRDLHTSLILSTHDFKGRPADLTRRILAMRQTPAKVLKIAFLARSLRDNLELFDVLASRDRPTIALAMGEFGLMSRVLAPKLGGFLTFASLRPTTTTAPGQPTISDLLNTYRFRSITPQTRVYGIIGDPVSHSFSPHLHNAGFEAVGHEGVYLPLPVPAGYEPLKATLLELLHHAPLTLSGLSVTIPHKEDLVRLAREQGWDIDAAAQAIGAANTVIVERGPPRMRVRITNTDAPALRGSLTAAAGPLAGARIALVGAGGVARAAAFSLAVDGAIVTIFNRTRSRADDLARELAPHGRLAAADLDGLTATPFDIYINCTPLGMKDGPEPRDSPLPVAAVAGLNPRAVVMDTIYTPLETPLLRAAREAGLRTVPGLPMFIAQAAAQFSAWTGHTAPAALFERIARERLA